MTDQHDTTSVSKILICEDEALLAMELDRSLRGLGYEIAGRVSTGEECIRLVQESSPDLILMDVKLAGEIDGIETAGQVQRLFNTPVVYLTGYTEKDVLERAKRTRPYGYLSKPVGFTELRNTIEMALYKYATDRKIRVNCSRDISDRKKCQQEVKYTEQALSLALESANMGLWEWDLRTGKVAWKYESHGFSGYPAGQNETDFNDWKQMIHPDDRSYVSQGLNALIEGEEPLFNSEYRIRSKSGEWQWVQGKGKVIEVDDKGKPVRMLGTIAHVSDKSNEDNDTQSKARYRTLFEETLSPVLVVNEQGQYLDANQAALDFLECSLEDLKQKKVWDWSPPERLEDHKQEHSPFWARRCLETDYLVNGKIKTLMLNVAPVEIGQEKLLYGIGYDITERKKAEQELALSRALLHNVVEYLPLPVFLKDAENLRYVLLNPAAIDLAGLGLDEFIGKTDYEVFSQDQANSFSLVDRQVLESLARIHIEEEKLETPHRGTRVLRTSKAPVLNEKGRPEYLLGITEDITEQREAERQLRETTELMQYIIKNDPNAIAVYDRRLNYIAVSNRYLKDYKLAEEDIIGKHHYEVFPEMPQRWKDVHQRCLQGAIESNDDDYFERPDGSITYNRWECRPWYDSRGDIGGIITYTEVTTERKLAEKALQESEAKFRRLFERSADPHTLYDHDGYFDCNEATIRILGLSSREELISSHPGDISPKFQPDGQLSSEKAGTIIETVFAKGSHRFNWVCEKTDGTPIYLDILCNRVLLQGKPAIHAVWRDVTEQKKAEDKIKKSLAEKEVLLREIHHRVKNNLASISSLLTLQSHHSANDLLSQELNKARDRIQSMSVAHELLYQSESLASIDVEYYLKSVVEHLINSVAGLGAPISVEPDITGVSFNIDTAIPLGFILNELVSNCLKHAFPPGSEGRIKISLRPMDSENFELIVADNGKGMPPDIDLDNPVSLGLELVNIFVDQLAGKMEISGEQGGAEVRITFKEIKKR